MIKKKSQKGIKNFLRLVIRTKNTIIYSLIAASFLAILYSIGFFSNINTHISDSLYGNQNYLKEIVIVDIDDYSINQIGRWPWDRSVYSQALNNIQDAKVVGIDISFSESSTTDQDKSLAEGIANNGNVILSSEFSYSQSDQESTILEPITSLKKAAAGIGFVNIPLDSDGKNRSYYFNLSEANQSFPEEIYHLYTGIQYDNDSDLLITNFAGPPGTFDNFSFYDLYQNSIDPTVFSNKIVLIGATAPSLHDEYLVPTSNGDTMAGIEIQANVIQNLLLRNDLTRQSSLSIILAVFVVAILVGLLMYRQKLWIVSIILLILTIAYYFSCIIIFLKYNLLLNLVYIPITILTVYLLNIIMFYVHVKKDKFQVVRAFQRYVSPEVVRRIIRNPKNLRLGGSRKDITIMFADIRGFTPIAENLPPEKVFDFLNTYLSDMSKIIMKHGGVIDKYIGDAIMAFWGAPILIRNHASLACYVALKMRAGLNKTLDKLEQKGYPRFKIGIGINTGQAVIGNVGSDRRFDYTAIGDSINIASRLENLTKDLGVRIIISESTQQKLPKRFITKKLQKVQVKGKQKSILVYELLAYNKKKKNTLKKSAVICKPTWVWGFNKNWIKAIKNYLFF